MKQLIFLSGENFTIKFWHEAARYQFKGKFILVTKQFDLAIRRNFTFEFLWEATEYINMRMYKPKGKFTLATKQFDFAIG